MNYSHEYRILPELRVNIQVYGGSVTLNAMYESMSNLVSDELYQESNDGIVDFRGAELIFTDDDLKMFIEFLHKANITHTPRRIALLTKTPNQVVYVSLFSAFAKSSISIDYRIFSTFEGVMKFLAIPDEQQDVVQSVIASMST